MAETRRFTVTAKHSHKETVPAGNGWGPRSTWVDDPDTVEEVEVAVDWDRIAREIGPQAVRNKSGRSRFASGKVEVRHIRTRTKKAR
jgi:hypothetical protein